MGTKDQYDTFRQVYDSEALRYQRLIDRAAFFLTVITLYMGLLAVAADEIVPHIRTSVIATVAYLSSFGAFVGAIILVVLAMGIRKYVYPTDLETVLRAAHPEWPADSEFFEDRMAELAVAFTRNHPINEWRATLLRGASYAILVGIVCQAAVLCALLFILSPPEATP
jgi:hypothetical protein